MLQRIRSRMRNAGAARNLFALVEQRSDPFSHPILTAMSAAELSDIPFPRFPASRARGSQRATN